MPGICTSRAGRAARARQTFDLHDYHSARVLHGHGLREVVDDECLALHGDVAGLVGRGATQKATVRLWEQDKKVPLLRQSPSVQPAAEPEMSLIAPPPNRGSTKVSSPTFESMPGFPAAMSR